MTMITRLIPFIAAAALLLTSDAAFAYVGPGAGLTMLGALWAVILAVLMALFFVVAWPVRRMLRRARHKAPAAAHKAHSEDGGTSKAA
jgi:membrane protein implicated in regulation of membrane protease activity